MDLSNLPHWVQQLVAASAGLGLFVLAFLDSTVLPFPSVNDLLLIVLSVEIPARMPYYASMVTLGSLSGCLVLFAISRKGGEMAFGSRAGPRAVGVQRWIRRNGFLSVVVAALLPPPAPFKLFVIAAGALGMPLRTFVLSLLLARCLRFFGEGYLAIRFGTEAYEYTVAHKSIVAIGFIVLATVLYLVGRWFSQRLQQAS